MRAKLNLWLIIFLGLTIFGCDAKKTDDDTNTPATAGTTTGGDTTDDKIGDGSSTLGQLALAFISEAANSLPQIKAASGSLRLLGTGHINTTPLANFFKQECYMPNNDGSGYDGFCPDDVKAELDAAIESGDGIGDSSTLFNKYKLTSGTLIGLIYHAQMYSQGPGLSNECSNFDAEELASPNAPAFGGGSDPDKFVIDYSPMLSCVKANEWDGNTTYATFGYNDNEDYPAIANLTARYGLPYGSEADRQTDIFQVYLGLNKSTLTEETPTPTFLAFNFVAAGGLRAVILANLVDHRFAVRYATSTNQILAIGTGGVDKTTGDAVTGYYMAKDITEDVTYCVSNSTGEYDDTTYASCETDIDFWDTMSAANVKTFLGINDEDAANISAFLDFFADTDALDAAVVPSSDYAADKADYFPETIQ